MTQQSESTSTTTTSTSFSTSTSSMDADEAVSSSVPAGGTGTPLAAPRPLGERRLWPRSFADRLTAPLPGLSGFARFAREGALRPGPEGLADISRLPYEPARCRAWTRGPSPSPGPGTRAG